MNNPCEGCSVYNVCGHAGGKPGKYQCDRRWIFNLLTARDKEWAQKIDRLFIVQLTSGEDFTLDHIVIRQSEWQQLKKDMVMKE